jgi:hypothetical protein
MAMSIYPETVPVVIQDPVGETSVRLITFPPEITQIREYIHETTTYDESDNLVIDYLTDVRYESITNLQLDIANRKFDIVPINWENKTPQPFSSNTSSVIIAGDYLYMMRGGTKEFWRYDIINDVWTRMQDRTNTVGNEPGICYDGSNFIYVYGGTTVNFERYNISTNSWTVLSNTGYVGKSLGYDPTGYIYCLRGDNNAGFYKYTISTNSWVSVLSVTTNNPNLTMPSAVINGVRYFFLLQGQSSYYFWGYNTSTNSLIALANIPAVVGNQATLVNYMDDYLLLVPGNNVTKIYLYQISTNTWIQVKNVQDKAFVETNSGGIWNDYLYVSKDTQELVRLKIFNLGTYDIEYISKRRLLLDKYKTAYLVVGNMMYYTNENYIPECKITFDDGNTWIDVPLLGTDLFIAPSTSVPVENWYYITNLTTEIGAKFKMKFTYSFGSFINLIELSQIPQVAYTPAYKNIIGAFFLK